MFVTEKRKPTYDLDAIKSTFNSSKKLNATGSAIRGAATLGFGSNDIVQIIQSISRNDFRKSMTSYTDHKVWQDVYNVPSDAGELYIKFTFDVVAEFLLLSFKEKNNG